MMPHSIIPIGDAQTLGTHLYLPLGTQKSFACVIIIFPNLSIAITPNNDVVSVFNSHWHLMKGATTIICKETMLPELCICLEKFCGGQLNFLMSGGLSFSEGYFVGQYISLS